jgi:hypothetical protein
MTLLAATESRSISAGLPALLVFAVLIPTGAAALGSVVDDPPPAAIATEDTGAAERLARALPTISSEKIGIDLDFIASDEMAGRDSPSPELRIAARYIRSRLRRLGFAPGASTSSYLYEYELAQSSLDLEASSLTVGVDGSASLELRPGRDYFFSSMTDAFELELEQSVVFCGYGRRDDFGPEVQGKWALCLDDGTGRRRRGQTAEAAGAAGLLTFPAEDYDEEPYAERFAGAMSAVTAGRVSYPSPEPRRAGFPQLFLSRDAGLSVLASAPVRPAEAADAWIPELGTELGLVAHEQRRGANADGRVTLENVCGFWPGADPQRAGEVIIVSAHYDHVGQRGAEIFNGADDNGSGTCGLLALAEGLAAYGPLDRSVLLIWVSAEEKGLLGSKAWADAPWLPEGTRPVANINIDMIGRNAPDQLLYTPTEALEQYYNGLAAVTEALAGSEGFTDLGSADAYYFRSDQAEFERLGIPVMFLFADIHDDYHQPTDTPDKIDTDKVRRVVRLVLRMLVELEGHELAG